MRNLLSSGFHRLWKDKVFWIGMLAMLVISLVITNSFREQAAAMAAERSTQTLEDYYLDVMVEESTQAIDDYYFNLAPIIGLFCAIFASLFIGVEHSEGTMRNKIVVGRTRTEVYLSNYMICFTAGICFVAVWLISGLIGIPIWGIWKMGIQGVLLYVVIIVFFTAAFTGIFTLLCMLSSNKAITAVLAILLALGLLMAASIIYNLLCEPEFNSGYVVTANQVKMADPTPNPNYVSGTKRIFYQFVLDCLPSGQGILMANLEIGRPVLSLISSTVIAFVTTIAGIFAFRKKDLK